ncbi:MAG: hypothetical protein ABSG94_03975 [Brevinematales bacterium]|jgi:hypothetical protein
MKKFLLKPILLMAGVLALSWGTYGLAIADDEPAVISLSVEPQLVVIPGTDTYYMDGYQSDVFFCDGFWYRPWHGGWCRSDSYSGRWVTVRAEMVPHDVYAPPHGWRNSIAGAPRMRYGEVRDNWQGWKANHYWKNNGWKRQGPTGHDRGQVDNSGQKHDNQNIKHNNSGQGVKTTLTLNNVKQSNSKQNNQKNNQAKSGQGQGKNNGGGDNKGGGEKNSGNDKEKKDK